jgi:hypothetical protein
MIGPQIIEMEGKPEYAVIPIAEWRRIKALFEELRTFATLTRRGSRRSAA